MTPEQLKKRARQMAGNIAEAVHRLHDRITGQETRNWLTSRERINEPGEAWEREQREAGRASYSEAARQDYAQRKSEEYRLDAGIERAEREGIAKAQRSYGPADVAAIDDVQDRAQSAFEARNPDAHALINKIAAIANDRAMDASAADRAINTLMTEHQRQKLGIVDRGDVYGIIRHLGVDRAVAQREAIAKAERDIAAHPERTKAKPARNRGRDDDLDLSL